MTASAASFQLNGYPERLHTFDLSQLTLRTLTAAGIGVRLTLCVSLCVSCARYTSIVVHILRMCMRAMFASYRRRVCRADRRCSHSVPFGNIVSRRVFRVAARPRFHFGFVLDNILFGCICGAAEKECSCVRLRLLLCAYNTRSATSIYLSSNLKLLLLHTQLTRSHTDTCTRTHHTDTR